MPEVPGPLDDFSFAEDAPGAAAVPESWCVLVVDDDPEVHAVTRLALASCEFEGRPLEVLSAHSAAEAWELIVHRPDIALIFLDVVMETEHAGLDLVRRVREELKHKAVRIVLRTGQPGQAPPRQVVAQYEIDDYRTKTELTFERLYILVMTALRAFRQFRQLEMQRRRLAESNRELERARQEAEAAGYAKATFLATMSHEIRTPLNAIVGMTDLLRDSKLDARQKEFVDIVNTSGAHLVTIINDILDFSKIESGKVDLDRHAFDLRRCVEEALELLALRTGQKQIDLAYVFQLGTPEGIVGDNGRVRQILLNYLSNAVKFTEKGEVVVTVSARPVDGGDPQQREFCFAVRDTGIGIPADRMDRLFRSFSQVDASTTRAYGGTGLGLAISKRLAELMGGRVWVESEPGKGSTFYFTIVADTIEMPARTAAPETEPLRGLRLLVVDDNATNRNLLCAAADSWNMMARATASPREALAWIERGDPFDLALIDYLMPEMSGVELAREIRRRRDERSLPLVLLSSVNREGVTTSDFVAFLAKPIRQSQLLRTLHSIASGGALARRPPPPTPSATRVSAALRILLAEDDKENEEVACLFLRALGLDADVVQNGEDAVRAAEQNVYDVILMDVQMPLLDGLEATREIRAKLPPERQPHIIAMTASAFDSDREDCLAAGMDDHIAKPIDRERLASLLSAIVPLPIRG